MVLLYDIKKGRGKLDAYELERQITVLLLALGFSPKNIGYHYLRCGLRMTVPDSAALDLITKNLYPALGKLFQTKAADIERTIRFTVGEWYKEKEPGAQIRVQEMGVYTVPARCPSNRALFKTLTGFLQAARTSPS